MFSLFQRTMILKFPNRSTFLQVLGDRLFEASSNAAARAGTDSDGTLYLEPSVPPGRTAVAELKRLGIQSVRTSPVALDRQIDNWLQLVPLEAQKDGLAVPDQAVVLFDLPSGPLLAQMATEVLRLGNDRQSFRWLGTPTPDEHTATACRALLRVVGPPYYTLLRAVAPPEQTAAPRAYLERAARVWVELGYEHPLAAKIKPRANQLLLLSAPNRWEYLPEASFRDVYDVLEFNLPEGRVQWQDRAPTERVQVSLKLIRAGTPDAAELWVLRDDPVAQLNAFVQNAEDQLLNRLAFAVGEHNGTRTIVLRVRPSKLAPPVLVLPAQSFAPYRKMPNLYLPCGWRLHPPLRRDLVRKKLADDPAILTWLYPSTTGAFVPETLPDHAFRPLSDWVDYVIDHEQQAIQAWIQAAHFEFESFVCDDDARKPKKPPSDKEKTKPTRPPRQGATDAGEHILMLRPVEGEGEPVSDLPEYSAFIRQEPSQLRLQLDALEERFLALVGNMDAPERQQLWPELARLNAALDAPEDAGLCYANAIWHGEEWDRRLAREWFVCEARAVPIRTSGGSETQWTAGALRTPTGEVGANEIELLLALKDPNLSDLRALAAYLVWAGIQPNVPPALSTRLNAVQRFLEGHERLLPVRACWLAWTSLTQMTHGDVLALARARDRLLERLFQQGLRAESDLPSFLRFAGQGTNQRFRGVRKWLMDLCQQAHHWATEIAFKPGTKQVTGVSHVLPPKQTQQAHATHAYLDLIFAFGCARMGELDACTELVQRAETALEPKRDDVHDILAKAYQYRILQARQHMPSSGPWPDDLVQQLKAITKMNLVYCIDKLRAYSRILEPEKQINAYDSYIHRGNELGRKLNELIHETDRKKMASGFLDLIAQTSKGKTGNEDRVRILRLAFEQAPTAGEAFALELFTRFGATYDQLAQSQELSSLVDRVTLLEKVIFVAAHFDREELVHALIDKFRSLLQDNQELRTLRELDALVSQCFRGLRKFGLKDQITSLLSQLSTLILDGQTIAEFVARANASRPVGIRALLHIASGWFYYGDSTQAETVLEAVRALLWKGELSPQDQASIAALYARTVGQASNIDWIKQMLEELLQTLPRVWDMFVSHSHYYVTQLQVVEAVIAAIVNEENAMGADARRWLDDDEFLVRKRIHRDLRQWLAHSHA